MQEQYFSYGDRETAYLKKKDKRLAAAIERLGHINRAVDKDLFAAVVHHIVGQQISTKAQWTIWHRLENNLGTVNAQTILQAGEPKLQSFGMTFKKAAYITDFASKVNSGAFDIEAVANMSDEEAINALVELKGIGVWTAEMILLFCLERPDVFSFGDLAILRGLRMLYRHREITKERFERYRKRYSPYGSVASLYLWAISGGAIPELTDPAPAKKNIPSKKKKV